MRVFIAALTIGVLTVSAFAQDLSGGGKKHRGRGQHTSDAQGPKKPVDDKAYKAALDKIPNQKYDPWNKMR